MIAQMFDIQDRTQMNRMREIREKKGVSMYRLAKMTGISASTINYMDSNESLDMSYAGAVRKIAKALGVTMEELMGY